MRDSCRPPGVAFWVANKRSRLGTYLAQRVAPLLLHKALPPLRSGVVAAQQFLPVTTDLHEDIKASLSELPGLRHGRGFLARLDPCPQVPVRAPRLTMTGTVPLPRSLSGGY